MAIRFSLDSRRATGATCRGFRWPPVTQVPPGTGDAQHAWQVATWKMLRRSRIIALSASLSPAVSHAIVGGVPDGEAHPNVGALILNFDGCSPIPLPGVPENTLPVCSGRLIAQDENRALFLAASHCIDVLRALTAAFAPLNPVPAVSFTSNRAFPGQDAQSACCVTLSTDVRISGGDYDDHTMQGGFTLRCR